jgi:hypothetical protein
MLSVKGDYSEQFFKGPAAKLFYSAAFILFCFPVQHFSFICNPGTK